MEYLKRIKDFLFANFFEKFFAAWMMASAVIIGTSLETIDIGNINIVVFAFGFVASYVFISLLAGRRRNSVPLFLMLSVLLFSMMLLIYSNTIYTYIATAIIFAVSVWHFFNKNEDKELEMKPKQSDIFTVIIVLVFFFVLTAFSVLRYKTFSAPNYDFGIFCNMFYNMKNSFTPLVSCERDEILSHFAVHFSPAVYVFLPFYYIFPSPVTIAVCQTAAIYSGIIPFVLIMKNRNIDSFNTCLFAVVYAANAAYTGGCAYDFHENCLLVPFMMWMFYFYEKKKLPLMFLFALFTLMVKEDAFVYVSVFAVYIILSERNFIKGASLLFVALAYFAVACYILEQFGTGIMANRYNSMIAEDEGLFGIVKTVLTNPGYAVKQIFNTPDHQAGKLTYFVQIMFPLAFIPFMTNKPVRLVLVLPVLLNLLTDYAYQYDISFQYSFAIMSLLLYLCVVNMSDMEKKKRDKASVMAAGLAVMMFFMLIIPRISGEANEYADKKEIFAEMEEVLDEIPEDARIAASTFLIPYLSERTELFEVYYTEQTDFEYLLFDMRPEYMEESLRFAVRYEDEYELTDIGNEYIFVYTKKQ